MSKIQTISFIVLTLIIIASLAAIYLFSFRKESAVNYSNIIPIATPAVKTASFPVKFLNSGITPENVNPGNILKIICGYQNNTGSSLPVNAGISLNPVSEPLLSADSYDLNLDNPSVTLLPGQNSLTENFLIPAYLPTATYSGFLNISGQNRNQAIEGGCPIPPFSLKNSPAAINIEAVFPNQSSAGLLPVLAKNVSFNLSSQSVVTSLTPNIKIYDLNSRLQPVYTAALPLFNLTAGKKQLLEAKLPGLENNKVYNLKLELSDPQGALVAVSPSFSFTSGSSTAVSNFRVTKSGSSRYVIAIDYQNSAAVPKNSGLELIARISTNNLKTECGFSKISPVNTFPDKIEIDNGKNCPDPLTFTVGIKSAGKFKYLSIINK